VAVGAVGEAAACVLSATSGVNNRQSAAGAVAATAHVRLRPPPSRARETPEKPSQPFRRQPRAAEASFGPGPRDGVTAAHRGDCLPILFLPSPQHAGTAPHARRGAGRAMAAARVECVEITTD
jgi:hypothetical protein